MGCFLLVRVLGLSVIVWVDRGNRVRAGLANRTSIWIFGRIGSTDCFRSVTWSWGDFPPGRFSWSEWTEGAVLDFVVETAERIGQRFERERLADEILDAAAMADDAGDAFEFFEAVGLARFGSARCGDRADSAGSGFVLGGGAAVAHPLNAFPGFVLANDGVAFAVGDGALTDFGVARGEQDLEEAFELSEFLLVFQGSTELKGPDFKALEGGFVEAGDEGLILEGVPGVGAFADFREFFHGFLLGAAAVMAGEGVLGDVLAVAFFDLAATSL